MVDGCGQGSINRDGETRDFAEVEGVTSLWNTRVVRGILNHRQGGDDSPDYGRLFLLTLNLGGYYEDKKDSEEDSCPV